MANAQHLQLLKQGKHVWNTWRQENDQIQPDLEEADLAGAKLAGFLLYDSRMQGANFTGASLRRAFLLRADLSHASLVEADLRHAHLTRACLVQATCREVRFSQTSLQYADFTEAQLEGASFHHRDLTGVSFLRANLTRAILEAAKLSGTDLRAANLSRAQLWDATLHRAQLAEANLSRSFLQGTIFREAQVQGADFTEAVLWDTAFLNMDLRDVRGLETVRHVTRSALDLSTWYRSREDLPLRFLRGIGTPESCLRALSQVVEPPIPEISGFLAYHPDDEAFAHRLLTDLQEQGMRCWLASEVFLGSGSNLVTKAFQPLDRVFYGVPSQDQPWIGKMAYLADASEREARSHRQLLFPLYLTQSTWERAQAHKQSDFQQERWLGNFVNWQEEAAYQQAFRCLLKALSQEKGSEPYQQRKEPLEGMEDE